MKPNDDRYAFAVRNTSNLCYYVTIKIDFINNNCCLLVIKIETCLCSLLLLWYIYKLNVMGQIYWLIVVKNCPILK
jgi:hypothetical protein